MNPKTLSFSRYKDAAYITIALQTSGLLFRYYLGVVLYYKYSKRCYYDLIIVTPNQIGIYSDSALRITTRLNEQCF